MTITIEPSGEACGAVVRGVDLRDTLTLDELALIRTALFSYHVLCFEEQPLSPDEVEHFASTLGELGKDPFLNAIPGSEHTTAIHRRHDETTPIFAEAWHADWTFLPSPPQATCLYGVTIPPSGGDTLFANQQMAYAEMSGELREFVENHTALHSARHTYSPKGVYAERAYNPDDSGVSVHVDNTAYEVQSHPFVIRHPHTDHPALFGVLEGYVIEVLDLPYLEALRRLLELREWQIRPEFQYRHRWKPRSLVVWDNYSVLHRATGGYDGYERLMHRVTVRSIPGADLVVAEPAP